VFRIFGEVINRVGNIADFGLKYGKGFGKRAAHPHPIFLGVLPSRVICYVLSLRIVSKSREKI